jgi:hypothetical protein
MKLRFEKGQKTMQFMPVDTNNNLLKASFSDTASLSTHTANDERFSSTSRGKTDEVPKSDYQKEKKHVNFKLTG